MMLSILNCNGWTPWRFRDNFLIGWTKNRPIFWLKWYRVCLTDRRLFQTNPHLCPIAFMFLSADSICAYNSILYRYTVLYIITTIIILDAHDAFTIYKYNVLFCVQTYCGIIIVLLLTALWTRVMSTMIIIINIYTTCIVVLRVIKFLLSTKWDFKLILR